MYILTCDNKYDCKLSLAYNLYISKSIYRTTYLFWLQFQVLQQQVGVLQDSAHQTDERYARAKADNAALQARVIMLEEQLRDTEMRHEERLQVHISWFFELQIFHLFVCQFFKVRLLLVSKSSIYIQGIPEFKKEPPIPQNIYDA